MERNGNRTSVILGTLLLAAGVLTLLAQFIEPAMGHLWPILITGFGLALFLGMLLGGRSFGALAIPASILTGIGIILLLQDIFGLWETWAYSWALIISLVGVGLVIYGAWSGLPDLRRSGWSVAQVGLTLFIIFGLLFEFVFSISGISDQTEGLFWPVILILLGLGMIIIRSYRLIRYRDEDRHADLNLFWPVIFIGAGILWYLIRLGALATTDLSVIISLWPILLVAAGVNLLLGRRLQWINLLLGIAVVVGMFYVIYNNDRLGLASRSPWGILGINFSENQPITEWITGTGVMTEETRNVNSFQEVVLNSSGELFITQGQSTTLRIEADEIFLPYLLTEVRGSRLTIETQPGIGFSTTQPVRYHLTVTDLDAIEVSGAGSINANELVGEALSISINGFGNINMEDIEIGLFDIRISGSGSATVNGSANQLNLSISGAGNFNGSDFTSEEADVEISGVGRAVVWATENLQTRISGLGSVSYYGRPHVTRTINGIGSVRQLTDK